ncbi:hypothetical protein TcWFU_006233 [Taenia crassiceps]|uniref:Uncharacterized protein n=1 Tax=Taenia crassiceps TaxID=6207 RepID=A0ABR4PZ34_9CEST
MGVVRSYGDTVKQCTTSSPSSSPPTDKPSLTIMATQSPAPNPLLLSISSFRPLSEEDTCRLTTHHTRCEPSNFTEVYRCTHFLFSSPILVAILVTDGDSLFTN